MRPIVIAHRGASGYLPEHTLDAYFLGAELGADYIEPDLVVTRDGVLVARHENEISTTTDVAQRPEFASRQATKTVDGTTMTGWFTEDFDLRELKTLRARERLPELRPGNARFDGKLGIATFEEILDLAEAINRLRAGRARAAGLPGHAALGVYPETKHPSYFRGLGLPMERAVVHALERRGFGPAGIPAFIQSFEVGNLQELRRMTSIPLVQLIEAEGRPYDFTASGDPRTYRDLLTPEGLAAIARHADAIGVPKSAVITWDESRAALRTTLIGDAHAARLAVHVWTYRAENAFLPAPLRSAGAAADTGDLGAELDAALAAGIDGFFTDHPDVGVAACARRL